MMKLIDDPTLLVYIINLLIALYGVILFAWWWTKQGTASSVFAYVTMIFLGEVVETAMAAYARNLWICGAHREYAIFMEGFMWPFRKIVTLSALILITGHMTWRIFHQDEMKRRKDDK
jgi:hypothetical protein